jgi:hypothetical protein
MADTPTGLPPGAVVKPIAQVSGLPPGAVLKPIAAQPNDNTVSQPSRYESFTNDVASGLGFDPQAIRANTSAGGQLLEMGKEAASNLGRFALNVAKDPAHIIDPINAMASGITKAAGLPDSSSQSIFDPNSYSAPNPGKLLGATAQVAAGIEAPDAAGAISDATKPVRNAVAAKVVEPLVAKTAAQTAQDVAKGINPADAIVDEGLVGSKKQMVRQADQRLSELSSQTDAALKSSPNANAPLDASGIVDGAIAAAQQAAKKSGNAAVVTRLDNLKAALTSQYGSLQGTPLQMQRLKQSVGEVAQDLGSFKATDPLEASAAGALRDIYSRLNDLISSKVPEVSDLNDRASKLISAKTGLLRNVAKDSTSILDSHSATSLFLKALKSTAASAPVLSGVAKLIGSPIKD